LFAECGWKSLGEISPDQFLKWRRQHPAGAKTLNEYLSAANTFINWIKRSKRLSFENPLQHVEKFSTVGQQTYERRPFTDEEMRRLIAVSASRSVVSLRGVLTAAHTGLRRKELRTLVWADVILDSPNPHIMVQARNAKNRKLQPLPLHPEVVVESEKARAGEAPGSDGSGFSRHFPKERDLPPRSEKGGHPEYRRSFGQAPFSLPATHHEPPSSGEWGCSHGSAALDAAQHRQPDHQDLYQRSLAAACGGN
jgi:integrase